MDEKRDLEKHISYYDIMETIQFLSLDEVTELAKKAYFYKKKREKEEGVVEKI